MTTRQARRGLALFQLFGGSFGLAILWGSARLFSQVGVLFFLYFLIIYAGITYAGILLWRDSPHADIVTAFAQMVQVPVILTPSVGYYSIAGLGLQLKCDVALSCGFYVHLGALFHFAWGGDASMVTLGINVVPVAILIWLLRQPEPTSSPDSQPAPSN